MDKLMEVAGGLTVPGTLYRLCDHALVAPAHSCRASVLHFAKVAYKFVEQLHKQKAVSSDVDCTLSHACLMCLALLSHADCNGNLQ